MRKVLLLAALVVGAFMPTTANAATITPQEYTAAQWAVYMDWYDYHVATGNAFTYFSGLNCNNSPYYDPKVFTCYYAVTVGGATLNETLRLLVDFTGPYDDADGPLNAAQSNIQVTTPGVRGANIQNHNAGWPYDPYDIDRLTWRDTAGSTNRWMTLVRQW